MAKINVQDTEILHNPDFKVVEFDHIKSQAGLVGLM